MAYPCVITVNIHKAHIYLWRKPQHMIRHLASSAGQQINGLVKIHLQKASVAAVDACPNLRTWGFSTLTCYQSQSQWCRGSHQCQTGQLNRETWPNRWAVYVKSTLSGNLINLIEAKTAQTTKKADNQPVSSSPKASLWMLVISLCHCPSTGSETTRGYCKLSSTAVTFHFPAIFSPVQPRGLCSEWKFTSPEEALSHKNKSLYVFLIPKMALCTSVRESVKDGSRRALEGVEMIGQRTRAAKVVWFWGLGGVCSGLTQINALKQLGAHFSGVFVCAAGHSCTASYVNPTSHLCVRKVVWITADIKKLARSANLPGFKICPNIFWVNSNASFWPCRLDTGGFECLT